MNKYRRILLIGICIFFALYIGAEETDSARLDPEWYVAPVIPASLRAPMRTSAAAASCNRVEAIQIFDIDSVLTEGTYYEYDDRGNVISTTVWAYASDGTMTGKSKNEYAFDAAGTQTMTAVYVWESAANDWKGTEKYEYIYQTVAGEKKMISNTSLIWLNGAWVADHRYTYGYDEAGREISYFEYNRNTTTNELQPVLGREQGWTNDLQTLEANYTAYANGQWTAGTKKEWTFDENGTQTMFTTFTMSNGAWVGSSKETWIYGGPSAQLTLHEKYGWANNDWSKTLKEETEYAGANIIRIENYSYANGVTTGTKKEEYAFVDGKKVQTIVYAWKNSSWVGTSNETWVYNTAGKLTLHEKSAWVNDDWSKTLREETEYSGANIVRVENYTYANGVATGTKKEEYTYSSGKKTEFVTYTWSNGIWANATKETWDFTNGKQTLHEQFVGEGANWSKTLREENEYSGANLIRVENYSYANGVATGLKYETTTYSSGKKTEFVTYTWSNGIWANATKETWGFANDKQTLHEQFVGEGTNWSKTLREENEYSGANLVRVENYSYENGVTTGTKKETYAYSGSNKTEAIVYQWANTNWVNYSKETWGFTNGKKTQHEIYGWNGSWVIVAQENTAYDGANLIRIENYQWIEGVQTGIQKEEYAYSSGKKIQTIVYAWTDGAWAYSTKNEASYQDDNTTISETNYTWNGTSWVGKGNRIQTTTVNGKVTETLTQNWPAEALEWTNASITTNTYNADGVNILTYNGTWNGSRWKVSSMTRTDIIKDDQGRQLLRASWKCSSDSVWKGVAKDTAAYTESGKTLYIAQYASWLNNNWVPSYRVEYQYDDMERVILNQRYDWKSNKWQGKYKYEYSYDDQGRQTMSASYKSWNTSKNNWVGSSKSEIVYDANGRIEKETSYKWSNNNWVYLFNNIYQYDAQGKEILHIVQSRGSNGGWMNSEKYEKEYRGNTLVKDYVYVWMNEEWQIYSLEQLLYDNDIQAKLRHEIKGLWNISGAVQSYTDKLYSYECDPRTIRFVNYDGTVLETQTLDNGVTPSYSGATPAREGNAEYSYIFAGWTPEIVPVTNNATYTATFTASKNTYTITWVDEAGNEIDQTTVEYGVMPSHEDAAKANTAEFSYEFTGWTPGLGIVTGDATYQATFKQTKNSYTITWKNEDGSVIESETLEYGVTPAHTNINKENTAEWTYTFAGWSPEIAAVTGDATYTATFTSTKNTYTVTWKNEDGSVIESEALEYGATPSHADITKDNTSEYTYTFAGWSPEIAAVTGDATYTATYTATKNIYTITWLNEDGTQIDQTTAEYGATPAHADINKESTAEFTYTFAGWTPGIGIVTGDASYTATFSATKNSYYIIWLNDDNIEIDRTLVEYGVVPTHTAPTKEATDEHSYFFDKWTPDVVAVTGEATYKATYTETTKVYTITWLNEDGTEISYESLEYGATPSHTAPTKDATAEYTYTFAGWNPAVTSVTGDASYTATFTATKRSYTITWLNEDGSEIEHETLEYGATPSHVDPTKEATDEFTYTFTGWSPDIQSVTGDASYTAQFNATKNSYYITWLNSDNSQLDQTLVEYGVVPTHTAPTKEATDEHSYFFAGWTPEVVAVTGEATYKATYTETTKVYTITWLNEDGTEISYESLEYGATPSHTAPTKDATAEYTYTFAGWNPAVTSVTGDASYTATFTATKRSYTITWLNEEGSEIDHTTVEYGVVPTHADATKENTLEYTYTFTGWTPQVVAVTGDASYTATFSSTANTYTITWKDENGVTLDQTTVTAGTLPAHNDPTKQNTAEYTYAFTGWTPDVVAAVADATYQAAFSQTKNSYTITWLDDEGTLVDQTKVAYGTMPAHANIYKESDDQYDYTFVGWTPTLVPVTGDASYSAIFTTAGKSYTVTFYFEDGVTVLDQMTLPYGAIPSTPYIPSIPSDANHTYTFSGWSPEIAPVTGDISYVPTFTAIPNQYTVIFRNYNGKELQRKKVDYGTIPAYEGDEPSRPATNSYTWAFEGWTPELVAVIGDATYTAVYTKVMNTYTILFYDEDGTTLLDEVTVEHGQKPTTSVIPTKEADEEYRYTFAGWSPKIVKATMDATYTATYTATPKTQGLGDVQRDDVQCTKVLLDGTIYIRRGGNTYSIDGQRVK